MNSPSNLIDISSIRLCIVEALEDADVCDSLPSGKLERFAEGVADIQFDEMDLDSIVRMELLVALETAHGVVITPKQFGKLSSLGALVSLAASVSDSASDLAEQIETSPTDEPATRNNDPLPPIIRLFQRAFRFCHTVAQLNKVLNTLEHRLTPTDVTTLKDFSSDGSLFLANKEPKYHQALEQWLHKLSHQIATAGKSQDELFTRIRIRHCMQYFMGRGDPSQKTLLICFCPRGSRRMMIPQPVLLQHVDASQYDLMIVPDPWSSSYRSDMRLMGQDVLELVTNIAQLDGIYSYKNIRTFGASAGGYPAIIAGYQLRAELAVSVAGRFPGEEHVLQISKMLLNTRQAIKEGQRDHHHPQVLMSYRAEKSRDRRYARWISKLTRGNQLGIQIPNCPVDHMVLVHLMERGQLSAFLQNSLFASLDEPILQGRGQLTTRAFTEPTSVI